MAQSNILSGLYDKLVTRKEKAIVAFVVATVGSYLLQSGLTVDQILTKSGLKALALGVVAHVLVYLTQNTEA